MKPHPHHVTYPQHPVYSIPHVPSVVIILDCVYGVTPPKNVSMRKCILNHSFMANAWPGITNVQVS